MTSAASRATAAGHARPLPPLPQDPRIAVVIPARQAEETLPVSIASVLAQVPPPDEVVIAVGPSTDATDEVAARSSVQDARVRVIANPSGRTPDALNAAIAATSGQIVARVDAQSRLPPGYLAAAVAALRATSAGNVGGLQVPDADAGFARSVAAAMRSPLGTGGAAYRSSTQPGPVDTVYLGVFRREALQAVGGFDPVFARNQDAELNLRLREAGYVVWLEPRMQVTYRPRGSVRSLASQFVQYGRWRRLTVRRHPGSLRLRQLVPAAFVVALGCSAAASVAVRRGSPLIAVGGGYLVSVLVGGVRAAENWRDAPATALALSTMHVSWGVGFLLGPPRESDASAEGPTAARDRAAR